MRRVHKHFGLALAISVVAHAAALRWAPWPAPARAVEPAEAVMVVALEPPEAPARPPITLGLDAPLPPSRTWLGFREFEPHRAEQAEVEQAAFADSPRAPPPLLAAAEPAAAASPLAPQPQQTREMPQPNIEANASAAAEPPEQPPKAESAAKALAAMQELLERMRAIARQQQAEQARRQAAAQSPAQAPAEDRTAPRPEARPGETAQPSNRESDPSSIIQTPRENWQLGKPLAAQGLEIRPRRPVMTVLTTLTAWPSNPLVKIAFDRAGVPQRAMILRSTGDSRVDSAIEASLYRWRAAGRQLQTLADGETVELTFRLLINPERQQDDGDRSTDEHG